MSWLSQWLKEIIMIILLAAFIDLLLPNRAMQRYVKLMMSLIILLILLSPVIKLFDAKLTDELASEWKKASEDSGPVYESLTTIQREAAKMSAARNKEVMKVATRQMEVNMKSQLGELLASEAATMAPVEADGSSNTLHNQQKRANVAAVQVQLDNNALGEPIIGSVIVQLTLEDAYIKDNSLVDKSNDGGIGGVDQVKPVMIDTKVQTELNRSPEITEQSPTSQHKSSPSDSSVKGSSDTGYKQQVEVTVIRQLTTQYLVKKDQITLQWE